MYYFRLTYDYKIIIWHTLFCTSNVTLRVLFVRCKVRCACVCVRCTVLCVCAFHTNRQVGQNACKLLLRHHVAMCTLFEITAHRGHTNFLIEYNGICSRHVLIEAIAQIFRKNVSKN